MIRKITNFHLMAKPCGSVCNLNCSYCFYLEKQRLYPERKAHWKMDAVTLENYIRKNIRAQDSDVVDFIWQGGEPSLAGLGYFRNVVRLQLQYRGKKQINNYFQTNGTFIDREWAAFFKQHNFLAGISIDGDRAIHERFRQTRSGKGSFDAVVNGLNILQQQQVDFNTLTVVSTANVQQPSEIYHFLKQSGSRYMQFIPLVERVASQPDSYGLTLIGPDFSGPCRVSEASVPAKAWGQFMNTLFDHWVQYDLGEIFVMNFEQTLSKLCGHSAACVIDETCGNQLIVEANGDVYSCDHFVYPENKLGNLNQDDLLTLVNSPQNIAFGNNKKAAISEECLNCRVLELCNGGCPKHRFELSANGRPGKNYLCDGFSLHLKHVLPRMKMLLSLLRRGMPYEKIRREISQHYYR